MMAFKKNLDPKHLVVVFGNKNRKNHQPILIPSFRRHDLIKL